MLSSLVSDSCPCLYRPEDTPSNLRCYFCWGSYSPCVSILKVSHLGCDWYTKKPMMLFGLIDTWGQISVPPAGWLGVAPLRADGLRDCLHRGGRAAGLTNVVFHCHQRLAFRGCLPFTWTPLLRQRCRGYDVLTGLQQHHCTCSCFRFCGPGDFMGTKQGAIRETWELNKMTTCRDC